MAPHSSGTATTTTPPGFRMRCSSRTVFPGKRHMLQDVEKGDDIERRIGEGEILQPTFAQIDVPSFLREASRHGREFGSIGHPPRTRLRQKLTDPGSDVEDGASGGEVRTQAPPAAHPQKFARLEVGKPTVVLGLTGIEGFDRGCIGSWIVENQAATIATIETRSGIEPG